MIPFGRQHVMCIDMPAKLCHLCFSGWLIAAGRLLHHTVLYRVRGRMPILCIRNRLTIQMLSFGELEQLFADLILFHSSQLDQGRHEWEGSLQENAQRLYQLSQALISSPQMQSEQGQQQQLERLPWIAQCSSL